VGRNKISIDLKYTNAGGRAYTPIDLLKSKATGREQLSSEEYSSFYENYYRVDFKVGYTLNSANKNRSHTVSLDLQNVTNHKNIFSQNYDNKSQSINTKYQLGFFPNVVYKWQF
jgi:NAD-dependent SIR2 family protein deacetylase